MRKYFSKCGFLNYSCDTTKSWFLYLLSRYQLLVYGHWSCFDQVELMFKPESLTTYLVLGHNRSSQNIAVVRVKLSKL